MFAAWEVGVWKTLAAHIRPDLVVGASAGALNGWAIAGGISPEQLAEHWLDPSLTSIRFRRPEPLHDKARELWSRFQPQIPFGLTVVEMPRLRVRLVREREVTWHHLAATCAVPLFFPSVSIQGSSCVDGGLMGSLPIWAAEEMGASRVIAVNCLTQWPFRLVRTILPPRRCGPALRIFAVTPSKPLGSLRDAIRWSRSNVERWIELGEHDGALALSNLGRAWSRPS